MRQDLGMIKNNKPRVSVILPAYNEGKYISRAVDSILAQVFTDFELLLIDDGSTDNTWEIMKGFNDPRIRKERLDRVGFTAALNHGLHLARGEYIARMDADDESLPERLERQVAFLDSHPAVSVVGTAYYKYDAMRNEHFIRKHPRTDNEIRSAMALYHPICHGTVMFRKLVTDKIGGYRDFPTASDLDLWIRAAQHFRFANLQIPLYVYWFSPADSYFEASLGHLKRTWISTKLHAEVIRSLQLPKYYYLMLVMKWFYYLFFPTKLKRLSRTLFSSSDEVPLEADSLPIGQHKP